MSTKNQRDEALERAIDAAGGVTALAEYITEHHGEISTQAISQWKRCPPDRVLQVEAAAKRRVTRNELRPDLYPPEEKVAA